MTEVARRAYDYDYADLLEAYAKLGVASGKLVYVGSDLTRLMRYAEPSRAALLSAHLRALRELLGPTGTLFVPTASLDLCNTQTVFDPVSTPSTAMGVFAEHVRTLPGAVRSFHPFWSVAGIGPAAEAMLADVPRQAYGWGSVWQRFVEHDVLGVNIGKSPHFSISVIHHVEQLAGVPYRYTKEFLHPVMRDGAVRREPFYLFVLYREMDAVRDRNRKIFEHFRRHGTLREVRIGARGKGWSFSHREFFEVTVRLMQQDIFAWLENPPREAPYRR